MRVSYANVMSTIAVFVSVGLGGAWAAGKITEDDLAKDSVTSKAIQNKTVKNKDVKDETLAGRQLKDGGIGGKEIADGAIGAAALAAGSVGTTEIEDGSVGASDLAGTAPLTAALRDGVEGDCVWEASLVNVSGSPVVSSRRNLLGEVFLDGVAVATPSPEGDGVCSTGDDAEELEDSTIFILPPAQRPAGTEIFLGFGDASALFVIGANGATVDGFPVPAGAVIATDLQVPQLLSGNSFLAASAPGSPAAAKAPTRIDSALLGSG